MIEWYSTAEAFIVVALLLFIIGVYRNIKRIVTRHALIQRAEQRPKLTRLPRRALIRRFKRTLKRDQERLSELENLCDEVYSHSEIPQGLRDAAGDIGQSVFNIRSYQL